MSALTELNLNEPGLAPAAVTSTIMNVTATELSNVIAFFLCRYVSQPFPFQLIECAIQHLHDQFKDFSDFFFEALATGESLFTENPQKANFIVFIKEVLDMDLFPKGEWKVRLEGETLKELKLIPDYGIFKTRQIRQNTAMLYKQEKFNLLRESSAGYSFLLVNLSGAIKNLAPYDDVIDIISFHIELIRVVEFIVQLFELNVETQHGYFLGLLSNCPWFEPNGQDDQKSGVQLYSTILGFRFSNSLGESADKLCHVAALMVKHNLAKVELFYTQLGPSLEICSTIFSSHVENLRVRKHKVSLRPQLESQSLDGVESQKPANSISKAQPIDHQRMGLLKALLSIGAYRDAKWILVRQPDFLFCDAECSALVCRLILALLDFAGEHHSKSFAPAAIAGLNRAAVADPSRKYPVLKALQLLPDQEFYYSDWEEEINEELAGQVFEWVRLLGPCIFDNELFARLASMAKEPLKMSKDSPEHLQWAEVMRCSLLPSLLVTGGSEGSHNILWDTLSALSVTDRFSFYDEWIFTNHHASPVIQAILKSSYDIGKLLAGRISAQNARTFGVYFKSEILRCPGELLIHIIGTVQKHGNIDPYVEVLRFLSKFTVDIFQFLLLARTSNPLQHDIGTSDRLKPDCSNIENWVRHGAHLAASMCRKSVAFSITTLLTYVVNQLHDGNPYDLVFLSELLVKLGGFETHDNLNDLFSLMGGRALRSEAYPQTGLLKATNSSAGRLADALVNSRLLPVLVVTLARQQQSVIFTNDVNPFMRDDVITNDLVPGLSATFIQARKQVLCTPGALGAQVDMIHDILLRLIELISAFVEPEKLRALPSLTDFCREYQIDAALAFSFIRPLLSSLARKDLIAISEEMEQGELVEDAESAKGIWLPSLQSHAIEFAALFKPMISRGICAEFHITFWQLCMYDIFVPEGQFLTHTNQLKTVPPGQRGFELSETRRLNALRLEQLQKEQADQQAMHHLCLQRINREKKHWFSAATDPGMIALQLAENCILPRCTISGLDALFCARFLILLHQHNTPGFSLILVIDRILDYFKKMLFLSSATEARHFGLFFAELFRPLADWNKSPSKFLSEVEALFAGCNPTSLSRAQKVLQEKAAMLEGQNLTAHDIFQFQMVDWNRQIFDAVFQCLESSEHMLTHSAFSVLAEINDSFPLTNEHNNALMQQVDVLVLDQEVNMNSIALSYKAKLIKSSERCMPAASFSRIHEILYKPAPEEPKLAQDKATAASPTPRSSSIRPSRNRSELEQPRQNTSPQGQKRDLPESSNDTRARPHIDPRDSRHAGSLQPRGNSSRERPSRHELPRDSGAQPRDSGSKPKAPGSQHRDSGNQLRGSGNHPRDSGHQARESSNQPRGSSHQPKDSGIPPRDSGRESARDRRAMPPPSREIQRDGRGQYNDRNNAPARNSPPFKRGRHEHDQPSISNKRISSPSDSRGARQRAESTLTSISGQGLGGPERAPRRGGMNSQGGRRLPQGSAANAHLQDNHGRRYNRGGY